MAAMPSNSSHGRFDVRKIVIVALMFFALGFAQAQATEPAKPSAHPYRVIRAQDSSSSSGRVRLGWVIVSPVAVPVADRAMTVVQAAKDLMAEAVGADHVWAKLVLDEVYGGERRMDLASATYVPDGKGASGREDGPVWEVEASDVQFAEQDLQIMAAWERLKPEYLAEDGFSLDEEALTRRILEELGLRQEDIGRRLWPSRLPKPFPYDGEEYDIVGTKAADSVPNPW